MTVQKILTEVHIAKTTIKCAENSLNSQYFQYPFPYMTKLGRATKRKINIKKHKRFPPVPQNVLKRTSTPPPGSNTFE